MPILLPFKNSAFPRCLVAFFLLLAVSLEAHNLKSDPQSALNASRMTWASGPDSLQQDVDSLVRAIARSGSCRVTAKVTDAHGNTVYSGFDGRTGAPVTDFSGVVEIGSCSKMFTAASILQLVEQKKLNLDDRLEDILDQPSLLEGIMATDSADYLGEVRLKHLLNHTSGLPEYFPDSDEMAIGIFGDSTLRYTPAQLVRIAKRTHRPQFQPGAQFKYSNTNYILLGMILEQHTGMLFPDYIQEHILNKAGLGHTYFASRRSPSNRMPGYWNGKPSQLPATLAGAAGEMLSTLDDMERFIQAWGMGEFFQTPSLMETVRTEYFNPMSGGISYGLGTINLFGSLGHAGQTFGFQTYMGTRPDGGSFVLSIDDAAIPSWGPAMTLNGLLIRQSGG